MRFQARILMMVLTVATVATTIAVALTYWIEADHVAGSAATDQLVVQRVTSVMNEYAWQHGGWDGIAPLVEKVSHTDGRRIDVITESGNRVPGLTWSPTRTAVSTRIDPRPKLNLRVGSDADAVIANLQGRPDASAAITNLKIDMYRSNVRLARCLSRAGIVPTVSLADGLPTVAVPAGAGTNPRVDLCQRGARSSNEELDLDFAAVDDCIPKPFAGPSGYLACLTATFANRIRDDGPEPLLMVISAEQGHVMPLGPVISAAGIVIACAAAGSMLVSRRMLRRVNALAAATRRLGMGGGWTRVRVSGTDEVADLTRTFNSMAMSIIGAKDRHRRMVADVAHELRTPLASLRSHVEALVDGVLPAQLEVFLSLHEEILLQQRIVDDLQDLALAEAGGLTYRRDRVLVRQLLTASQTAFAVKARALGVHLMLDAPVEAGVHADPDRLRQSIGILISNALRYTPPGGVITLRSRVIGGTVAIEVADTGTGITADDLPHIFDRFWRADHSRARATGGFGLGLAIARQIINAHHGTISVASQVGKYTIFTIRLPLVEVSPLA